AIQWNLAPGHSLKQHHDITRRLQSLIWRWRVHRSRYARNEAVCGGIIVTAVRKLTLDPFGSRPIPIRQLSIRRIDDHASRRGREEVLVVTLPAIIRTTP